VGFGFGVVWMTVGLGPAILCLVLAVVGYGAVFMAERAEANRALDREDLPLDDEVELEPERYDEPADDAASPLTAEVEYGWPWPGEGEERLVQEHAPVTHERA
jgi:uncharacterized membrane protein